MFWNNLMYSLEKLSGPGDLPLGSFLIIRASSPAVNGRFRSRNWESEREGRLMDFKKESIAWSDGSTVCESSFKLYNFQ